MDGKLPDDITLKNVVIFMTCVIKDNCKFYPQIFLEEVLFLKYVRKKQAWHLTRRTTSFVLEDEKKNIEPIFIDERQHKVVGTISTGKNTIINYQLLNSDVA